MTGSREVLVKSVLDGVRKREDLRARRANDPVDFVHRYRTRADRELVALVSANLAFGNVKAIRAKVGDLLAGVKFEPGGPVSGHDRIKHCTSLPDLIGRHLLIEYCGRDDLAHTRNIGAADT